MSRDRRHVLVTDAGRGSAVAFIRSLGRRGWRVTAADHDRRSVGFRSRYVSRRLLHLNPRAHVDAAVDQILQAVRDTGVDLVIPITDETGLALASARHWFEGRAILALPDPAAMAATQDKIATLELARRLGIPVPPTCLVEDVDSARTAAAELGYPLVVKPEASRLIQADGTIDRLAVKYAGNDEELVRRMRRIGEGQRVLLQGWVPGDGVGVELLLTRGRPIAAFQHHRLRQVPVTGGVSSLRESVALDPTLLDHASRLLGELDWTGLAMVEFRQAPDGVAHLMEINGRVWGSLPLASRAGMDFPARLADLFMDGPPPEGSAIATEYRHGVRSRNLRLDVAWIRAVLTGRHRRPYLPWPPRRAALGALASFVDPRIADDLFQWSDPWPGVAQLGAIARDAAGRRSDHG